MISSDHALFDGRQDSTPVRLWWVCLQTSCRRPPTTHVHWPCSSVDGVVTHPPSARYVPGCYMIGRNFKRTTRRCVGDVYDGVMCRIAVVCRCSLRVYTVWWLLFYERSFLLIFSLYQLTVYVPLSVDRCSILVTDQPIRQTVSEIYFISCRVRPIFVQFDWTASRLVCTGEVESSSAAQPRDARIH